MLRRWVASINCRDDQTVSIDSVDALRLQRSDAASALSNASADLVSRPRRIAKSRVSTLATTLLCLVILLCCSPCVTAAAIPSSEVQTLVTTESVLLFDRSTPPEPPMRLIRRAEHSMTATKSSSSLATATSQSSTSLPSAFDTALGNNFTTSSCPAFFRTFLSNDTFNECVPLSLLLQRSPVRLAQTLGASCGVDFDVCSSVMASLARQIQLPSNCGADLEAQNPMAVQAYDGFVAYQPLYHAGCLLNSETGSYCFSDAVTNASSPTDSYVYYLPLGVSLPGSTLPSCSNCLRDTMSVFASAATNSSQPASKVYAGAASMIDQTCGAEFVNASIPHTSGAAASVTSGGFGAFGTLALVISMMAVLL